MVLAVVPAFCAWLAVLAFRTPVGTVVAVTARRLLIAFLPFGLLGGLWRLRRLWRFWWFRRFRRMPVWRARTGTVVFRVIVVFVDGARARRQ